MNFDSQAYSKEEIKARILKNATKLWGVRNIQSLDPFVKLLVDAFSTEVFKANNEIQNVNGRITEKLARLLTPSLYAHPSPAHAIASCSPRENKEILMAHNEFFLKKQLNAIRKGQSDRQVEVPFTPIDNVDLVKAQTVLMIAGNTLYDIDEYHNKTPISRLSIKVEDYRTIRLGIDVTDYAAENFPEKLSLYCASPTFGHLDYVYRLLPYAKFYQEDTLLTVTPGRTYAEAGTAPGFDGIFEEQSVRHKIKEDIKQVYQDKFIQIEGLDARKIRDLKPGNFPEIDVDNPVWNAYRKKKIVWLTMEFPPQFTAEVLQDFLFVLNAFPVYNRGWKKTEYELDVIGNNIPLNTADEEYFLYVEEVMDGQGRSYDEIPFTPNNEVEKGLYTVRKGGMERFVNRNAIDAMSSVMELLRDEVAAFSIFNRDKVKDVLGEIGDKMKGLKKKIEISDREFHEDINYVIVEHFEQSDHSYAAFWVSHCSLANNIRPGTNLNSQENEKSIILLTETTGGAEEQKQSDTVLAYKYALTTRDKIISIEDVKNYCKMTMGNQLKEITVKRGTMVSDKPREGFIRTVDINIIPLDYTFYGHNYWEKYAKTLNNKIKSKAIDGIEYRVAIQEEMLEGIKDRSLK